jgi:hypothetical protein
VFALCLVSASAILPSYIILANILSYLLKIYKY